VRRFLALAIVAVGLVIPTAASSSARHTPASNGWIVFASDRTEHASGAFRLYRIDLHFGRVRPLGRLSGRWPAWSPDGSLIAYVDAQFRLVVARADGRRIRTLPTGGFPVRDPAWSPDGSRIVVTRFTQRRAAGDIAVLRADGSRMTRITRTWQDDSEPVWSPDGSTIVFVSNRDPSGLSDRELYRVRPDGRQLRPLTNNVFEDRSPAWSPDGGLLAFVSGRTEGQFNPEVWTMRSDGTAEHRVQSASAPGGFPSWSDDSPSWSPDGNWLVYVTNETNYPENVFIVRPDGRDKVDLTPETRSSDLDPAWQPVCSDFGSRRNDRLTGTPRDDRVCGFAGSDSLAGGAGRDGLYGGDGADRLRSVDGTFDVVGCGGGNDVVVADRADLVGVDCEHVRRR
jgi:Tol biopolymer transport system component